MLTLASAVALLVAMTVPKAWDWTEIIGTGQSLSVGERAFPVATTQQPFGNLKLSSDDLQWPVDPNDPKLGVEPLVEPVGRLAKNYPSSWPENISGETPQSSAANQISYLVQQRFHKDYVTVHINVGENGQGMIRIRKNPIPEGVTGRSYEAAMVQTKALARIAKEKGKSFGVGAIFITHGESDAGNPHYEDELYQLWSDYDNDIKAITGQQRDVLMIVSQHNRSGEYSPSTIAQWKSGLDHPEGIVCSGPKYQYPYSDDAVHLTTDGYRMLGEKYGQVYFERLVLGHPWKPLEPEQITRQGKQITIHFHVPVKPLVWDTTLGNPHPSAPEWSNGKGFEVTDAAGKRLTIDSVILQGSDAVLLTLKDDPGPGARIGYAMVGEPTMRNPKFGATPHWGLLRDSDPFVGYNTKTPQPNFCVAFVLTAP